MSGAFNSDCHFALVFGTIAGLPARADFAIFMNIATQQIMVLIIDLLCFIAAEGTVSGARIKIATIAAASAPTAAARIG